MIEISNVEQAIAAIHERGYLNEFQSRCDCWFAAHSVPGGLSVDCPIIKPAIADELIGDGIVKKTGQSRDLEDPSCLLIWYELQ